MSYVNRKLSPDIQAYYDDLKARNELTRSDVSIYASYTGLIIPYRVICRQRYHKNAVLQRQQFIKEIKIQEALQNRALDGIRVHREFCDPVVSPPVPAELITLTRNEKRRLERILDTTY